MRNFAQLDLIGRSQVFCNALVLIEKFAVNEHAVLVEGETGTGKELAARAIHYLGPRRAFPFIPVNCGALPESLVESELFGHARGAFTDAREARPGIIAQARGGTLFLDEIEAMAPRAQVALLRFLQDRQYRPVGAAAMLCADVRIIGATNVNLASLLRSGGFRADLLFRLNVLKVELPPLRERQGDVMVLAEHFVERLNNESKSAPKRLHEDSVVALSSHRWPGNVRELENLLLRRYLLEPSQVLHIRCVEEEYRAVQSEGPREPAAGFKAAKALAMAAFEQSYVTELLARSRGNLSLASRLSGKDRSDLCKLLRKHGIQRAQFERG